MSVLDSAIANVALPTIARHLSAAPAESIWVVNAYQLVIVVSLLPLAALGEIVGYRRVFQVGLILFTIASAGCTQVHSLPTLILARALQGFGAASIMSVNGALVRYTYPSNILGRGVGLNALVVSVSAALGPTIAAGILAIGPWEWLFAINVPIGIGTYFLGRVSLPETPSSGKFDLPSTIVNIITFGLGFTGIDVLTRGGNAWLGAGELAAAVTTGTILVLRSLKQEDPLVPVDLLKIRIFTLSVATSVTSFTAQMLTFVSLPFFLEGVLHRTQVETGLVMTPWPVASGISAAIAGRLSDRLPAAILGSAGLAVLASGLLLLAFLPAHATPFEVCWRMALCGSGFGFFQSPNNRTMLSSAPLERSGAAAGMLATARLTGQTAGATIAAICFRVATHVEPVALTLAAIFAALAAVASLSRLAGQTPTTAIDPRHIAAAP